MLQKRVGFHVKHTLFAIQLYKCTAWQILHKRRAAWQMVVAGAAKIQKWQGTKVVQNCRMLRESTFYTFLYVLKIQIHARNLAGKGAIAPAYNF